MEVQVCPRCDAVVNTPFCLRCGFLVGDISTVQTEEGVTSIIEKITEEKGRNPKPENSVDHRIVNTKNKFYPLALVFLLSVLCALAYWKFLYLRTDYLSPLVLSAKDIREQATKKSHANMAEHQSPDINDAEKTLVYQANLEEGNFDSEDFARFSDPEVNLYIQAFNIRGVYNKFVAGSLLKSIQDDYNISDDDIEVYFSKSFGVIFPDKDLNTWGLVMRVKDKAFVSEKLDEFNKNKEDKNYKMRYLEAVIVSPVDENTSGSSSGKNGNSTTGGENDGEDSSGAEGENYLLISNSKVFLDRMKEASEGNLPTLKQDIAYAKIKGELPKSGHVFVYKKKDSITWKKLVEKIAPMVDYVGIDKILSAINHRGIVFYSAANKLKIVSSKSEI